MIAFVVEKVLLLDKLLLIHTDFTRYSTGISFWILRVLPRLEAEGETS